MVGVGAAMAVGVVASCSIEPVEVEVGVVAVSEVGLDLTILGVVVAILGIVPVEVGLVEDWIEQGPTILQRLELVVGFGWVGMGLVGSIREGIGVGLLVVDLGVGVVVETTIH